MKHPQHAHKPKFVFTDIEAIPESEVLSTLGHINAGQQARIAIYGDAVQPEQVRATGKANGVVPLPGEGK